MHASKHRVLYPKSMKFMKLKSMLPNKHFMFAKKNSCSFGKKLYLKMISMFTFQSISMTSSFMKSYYCHVFGHRFMLPKNIHDSVLPFMLAQIRFILQKKCDSCCKSKIDVFFWKIHACEAKFRLFFFKRFMTS